MRSITKQLDMSPGAISPVVHVSQYDSDFSIVFNLYCTDGTFTLESGTTAEVRGTKKSGTGYSAAATVNISAKTVTVTGHKQMTAVAGDNVYEITLYKGSKELNSINFVLAVERAAMDQDTVVDETTIREFGELKTYIEDVKADTAASASAAQASQTAAAASASASAQSAIEAAQSAQSVDAERLNRIAFGSYVVEESTGFIAHFEDGADNIPMKDVLVHIEPVQAGSGDPSPNNVRAITGWTKARVTRAGKNLLISTAPKTITKSGVTATKNDDGSITLNGTATNNDTFEVSGSSSQNGVSINVNDTVTISGCPSGGSTSAYRLVAYVYKNNTYTNIALIDTGNSYTRKVDFDSLYCVISVYSGVTYDNLTFYPQLELGSTATDYEPYSGQTYSITFPSEAGTVYGGTLDVTSGVLTVTHKLYTFDGSENWRWSTVSLRPYFVFTDIAYIKPVVTNLYPYSAIERAIEKTITTNGGQGDSIWVKDSEIAPDLASWKAFLTTNPLQVVYELATPITYQLTPQEITSLLGENNLWADTGNSDVEYRANTELYITKKITEAVSALS